MPSEIINRIKQELKDVSSPERAKINSYFFKTGKGHYGEGDIFIGVKVPEQRLIAKKNLGASFQDIQDILSSEIHEHRLTALLIIVEKYKIAKKLKDSAEQKKIFDFYFSNIS